MSYLTLTDVTKSYGSVTALDRFSLEMSEGESVVLLGPSGCGKTTCLRTLAGFERPDSGQIEIDGRTLVGGRTFVPPESRRMAVMFQSYALWPHMTVFDNVAYGPRTSKVKRAEVKTRVERVLEHVDLAGYADRFPHQLSGGQQQRVAMARALVTEPSLLLLDEPLSNLDTRLREEMRTRLKNLRTELGVTMLYVTHDQSEALALADRLVVMRGGRIEQVGSPENVYRRPRNRYVALSLGSSNLIPATVRGTGTSAAGVDVELLGTTYRGVSASAADAKVGEERLVSVRPADITLDPAGEGPKARIVSSMFFGDSIAYEVSAADGQHLSVLGPGRSTLRPGDDLSLTIDPSAIALLDDQPSA